MNAKKIQIIPSIQIYKGKIIRTEQGDFDTLKQYDKDPVSLAKSFEDSGIKVVHIVDLDGTKKGIPENLHIVELISQYTSLEIDFTGGVNLDGDVNHVVEAGAHYITAGSVAVENKDLFSSWIISYGREKITLSADADQNEKIVYRGWQKQADLDLFEHIEYFYNQGLKYAKVTDISREGVLQGPNFELYQKLRDKFPNLSILASGGVRNVDDIRRLNDMGMFAVIFGKALYEEKIKLSDLKEFMA
ncbi:MAG: 1-(5-phosphoribosyl)-5-[(5-phosphoribosylamino)methylideneamino] imidazole-4-carboxamide isomerase [Cyclobacteriaceae bacterium]|nr:1-(5-phosphoribosyl)-5-[(5-phosphoribosylamino)methylideneamino] imidazole-4-carboxamide isomerase [Cyclobacteriaceae bacterium]MCH8516070.1 1-(5-phosphoribosyl)-5-[(5-phosphoribosylamino)methylideneamino] imidazole-4-carboxamide isomerase [Cyclobacteriaceae bacterium]